VELGVDINKARNNGETPLFDACLSCGNEALVKYLVENGANINKKSKNNETPLIDTCRSGNEAIVKYLIE